MEFDGIFLDHDADLFAHVQRLTRHVKSKHAGCAGGGRKQSREDLDCRGFPGAVRAK